MNKVQKQKEYGFMPGGLRHRHAPPVCWRPEDVAPKLTNCHPICFPRNLVLGKESQGADGAVEQVWHSEDCTVLITVPDTIRGLSGQETSYPSVQVRSWLN
jgi:hypothetical protein